MKKSLYIIAVLIAATATSCQKKSADTFENDIKAQPVNGTEFGATFLKTKTVIGAPEQGFYTPLWTESDAININGTETGTATVSDGGNKATFVIPEDKTVEAPYCAVSPADAFMPNSPTNCIFDPEARTMEIIVSGASNPQVYSTNGDNPTYSPNAAICAAFNDGTTGVNDLTFHQLTTYYKITVAGGDDTDNIRLIYVRQGDGSNLAGRWKISFNGTDDISLAPAGDLSSVIALDCGESGVAQGTPMIIGIPAYNFANGLIITVKDVNGHFESFAIPAKDTDFSAKAGAVIDFKPQFSPAAGTIMSVQDWNEFAAATTSKNDWALYRWVGNGTVKLGADIDAETLPKARMKAGWTFDGQNHTISQSDAKNALFVAIHGVVKNLVLDGSRTDGIQNVSSLADTLHNDGSIQYVTTKMNVTNSYTNGYTMMGGLIRVAVGGTIDNCTNEGNLTANLDFTSYSKWDAHRVLGGIVCQTNNAAGNPVVIRNCTNKGILTINPIYKAAGQANGLGVAALGGIVGWVRSAEASLKIEDCTNEATLNYTADNIQTTTGPAAASVNVGGIAGLASPVALGQFDTGRLTYPSGSNGILIEFTRCTNTGTINNDGISYSDAHEIDTKSYAGGIVGSVAGNKASYAKLTSCTNTGNIYSYSKCLDGDGAYPNTSTRPGFCCVLGGLAGLAGYVDASDCYVRCALGNGKRPVMAIAGGFGVAVRPFKVTNSSIWFEGFFSRFDKYGHNRSVVATVPMECCIDGGTVTHTDPYNKSSDSRMRFGASKINGVPDIKGSIITDCKVGASLRTSTSTIGWAKDKGYDQTLVTTAVSADGKVPYNATILNKIGTILNDPNNGCSLVHGQFFPKGKGESDSQAEHYTYSNVTYWDGN